MDKRIDYYIWSQGSDCFVGPGGGGLKKKKRNKKQEREKENEKGEEIEGAGQEM